MKIGIIGSGNVGLQLGGGCIDLGHHVMIGTRNPEKKEVQEWLQNSKHRDKAFIGTFAEASAFGEGLSDFIASKITVATSDGDVTDGLSLTIDLKYASILFVT